jgi:elongation factor P hydroxylase
MYWWPQLAKMHRDLAKPRRDHVEITWRKTAWYEQTGTPGCDRRAFGMERVSRPQVLLWLLAWCAGWEYFLPEVKRKVPRPSVYWLVLRQ